MSWHIAVHVVKRVYGVAGGILVPLVLNFACYWLATAICHILKVPASSEAAVLCDAVCLWISLHSISRARALLQAVHSCFMTRWRMVVPAP